MPYPPRNDDLGNDPKDPINNVKEPSDDFVFPVDPPRNDDLGNDPKDPTKNSNDPSGDSVLPADSLRNDNLGNDTSNSIRENLWNELNSQLDEQQEKKSTGKNSSRIIVRKMLTFRLRAEPLAV